MEEARPYSCTALETTVPLETFRRSFVDVPRVLGYCRDCPNFGRRWSCPPFAFDPLTLWKGYGAICLYARKLTFSRDRLFPGERRAFEEEELPKVKADMARELLARERSIPGSLALLAGKCDLCSACAREAGQPCRFPERMRYSVEALGGDCGGALEAYFGESLRWARGDRLPEQMILLGGLLLPKE